jgi:hypothetical protein
MAKVLLLVALAHHGNCSASREVLKQPQRKFLPVILDCSIPLIEAFAF